MIRLELRSAGDATAYVDGRSVELGMHGLSLLAACSEPKTVAVLVDEVVAKSGRDFAEIVSSLLQLCEKGLLVSEAIPARVAETTTWANARIHIGMLDDDARTQTFLAAVRATVRPGDVVLDIGSGTGVLAVGAALAGAKHVFAMEASAMAEKARELARSNGVADRVTVIQGWSTRLDLPERASVLVTETLGNDPLVEHIIEIVADAKRRLLTPDARIIPRAVKVYAALASLPDDLAERLTFGAANTARWSQAYGIDFSALAAPSGGIFPATVKRNDAARIVELSEPELLGTVDFSGAIPSSGEHRLVVKQPGRLAAILTYFEADLANDIVLSTRPRKADPKISWRTQIWVEPAARDVIPGDAVRIRTSWGASYLSLETL